MGSIFHYFLEHFFQSFLTSVFFSTSLQIFISPSANFSQNRWWPFFFSWHLYQLRQELYMSWCPNIADADAGSAFLSQWHQRVTHVEAYPAGTNGYSIPDPNLKYFSIPDPYPINFQNHRVFRVSGITENQVFDMNPFVWILAILSSF